MADRSGERGGTARDSEGARTARGVIAQLATEQGWRVESGVGVDWFRREKVWIEAEYDRRGRLLGMLRIDNGDIAGTITGSVSRHWPKKRETLAEWLSEPVQGGGQR